MVKGVETEEGAVDFGITGTALSLLVASVRLKK